MTFNPILLLAVGLVLGACAHDESSGPSARPDGRVVLSTFTTGDDPDQDGYVLSVDDIESLSLVASGTTEIRLTFGRHSFRLLGVAEHCAVADGIVRTVDVPSAGTILVSFEVRCPPQPPGTPGTLRITAPTSGPVPDATRYSIGYATAGYWDIPGGLFLLGALDPNGSLIVDVLASQESGADPYWYGFQLRDFPGNCSVRDPHPYPAPGFEVLPGDTLDIEFAVTCSF